MAGFNDIFWTLSYRFPGSTRGCAYLAIIAIGISLFTPFIQVGEAQLTGLEHMQNGWKAVKVGHFAYKILFVSWLSTVYLLFSMLTIRDNNNSAKPELMVIMFVIALGSLYVLSNYPYDPNQGNTVGSILTGSYIWVGAFFLGSLSHSKSVYN